MFFPFDTCFSFGLFGFKITNLIRNCSEVDFKKKNSPHEFQSTEYGMWVVSPNMRKERRN